MRNPGYELWAITIIHLQFIMQIDHSNWNRLNTANDYLLSTTSFIWSISYRCLFGSEVVLLSTTSCDDPCRMSRYLLRLGLVTIKEILPTTAPKVNSVSSRILPVSYRQCPLVALRASSTNAMGVKIHVIYWYVRIVWNPYVLEMYYYYKVTLSCKQISNVRCTQFMLWLLQPTFNNQANTNARVIISLTLT